MRSCVRLCMVVFCCLCLYHPCLALEKHALLINVTDYKKSGLFDLESTKNDIELVKTVLIERLGFKESNIIVKPDNSEWTHTRIRDAFKEMAAKINQGDYVYIHYSGHGSLASDENGDEQNGSGKDQTWVPYGARAKSKTDTERELAKPVSSEDSVVDEYDILDDEIGEWLIPIYQKTEQVVIAVDSCNSATVTRGGNNAPRVRAAPPEERPHPLAKRKFQAYPGTEPGIRVFAARADEPAREYTPSKQEGNPDRKTYGAFSWFWAKAIEQAQVGETWDDIYNRVSLAVTDVVPHHPQLERDKNRGVLQWQVTPTSKTVLVLEADEKTARIKAGSLVGVTEGSIYRIYNPGSTERENSRLQITRVEPFESRCRITAGTFKRNDLVIEQEHVYAFEPLRVYLACDLEKDKGLLAAVAERLADIPAYERVENQSQSDLVLYVLRPDPQSVPVASGSVKSSLPESNADQLPQVWVLTSGEELYAPGLQFPLEQPEKGVSELMEALKRIARVRELKRLASSDFGAPPPVQMKVYTHTPVSSCKGVHPCVNYSKFGLGEYRLEGPAESSAAMNNKKTSTGQVLSFTLHNTSEKDYHCYLLDISPDGSVRVMYPEQGGSEAQLKAGKSIDLSSQMLLKSSQVLLKLDRAGEETVKLIATKEPVNIHLLSEPAYSAKTSKGHKGDLSPLDRLLASANSPGQTKGEKIGIKNDEWFTDQFTCVVSVSLGITREEAQSPDAPPLGTSKGAAPGPEIKVIKPDTQSPCIPPVPIEVKFEPRGSAQVDPQSIKLWYVKLLFRKDITDLIKPYVTKQGINIPDAALPKGKHTIEISLADTERNVTRRSFSFEVQADKNEQLADASGN